MTYDFIFMITLLTTLIVILGFVAPPIGFAAAITWTAYGTTRLIQELVYRKNVS